MDSEDQARSSIAVPVNADAVHLKNLPEAGVAVGSSETVVLVGLDGTIVTTLPGYAIVGNPGAPGLWLQRGPTYYRLDVAHGLIVPVGADRAKAVMYDEGAEPSLPPPIAKGHDGKSAGHWRYADESPSGATLAQWSGECEVPTAYWISEDGTARIVTGESDASKAPESLALGWTANGRAVVLLPTGTCGSSVESPGVYLYSSPGVGRLVYRTEERSVADSWGSD